MWSVNKRVQMCLRNKPRWLRGSGGKGSNANVFPRVLNTKQALEEPAILFEHEEIQVWGR